MFKKIAYIGLFFLIIVIFYSLGKQIYDSLEAGKRVENEVEKLTKLQKRNWELKKKLTEVQSLGFIESQARDKLNLGRAGENVAIISQEALSKVLGKMAEKKIEIEPYWQGWLKLFWK